MGVDASAVARVLGIETKFQDLRAGSVLSLPQRIAIFAQGATNSVYSLDKFQITSAVQAGQRFGFGSPIHLIAEQLFPVNGDGVGTIPVTVYPLEDEYEGEPAAGDITPTGSQTKKAAYKVRVNNIDSEEFVVDVGDSIATITAAMTAAINAELRMPVTASDGGTKVDLTSKWAGTTANDLYVEIVGEDLGVTYAITHPTGGLVNPALDAALAKVGDVWETMALNALGIDDSDALDALDDFGEGRWGSLVRKPLVAFTGVTDTTVAAATTVSSGRRLDRTNAQLVAPGSRDLPFVVAARQLARIAKVANNNPPTDYGSQRANGLTPGDDGDQWDYAQRDQAVKAGSSTVVVKNGDVYIGDVVTFYRPQGDPLPAYRFVVDIVKLQNVLFNVDLIFNTDEWDGAPLIPDGQATVNPNARKPASAVAEVSRAIDGLALQAIISNPEAAKANTSATIDSQNPKRLNVSTLVQLAGNTNIIDVGLNWGFFFG